MTDQVSRDDAFMAEAIALGRQHLGRAWPNPSVGAVVVRDGRVIGRGVTAIGGRPHAEPQALAEAGAAARGATLYVTLEPCSHHGRTPPCAEAVIAAGIARVVVAVDDPDSRVSGRGLAMLRAAGIEVATGIGRAEAERGLRPHLTRIRLGRPFVTLKMAVSADGFIGRRDRGNVAVTGAEFRTFVHRRRAESDAIAVGIGTALADDPLLNIRLPDSPERAPVRVVFDADARLPVTARMLRTRDQGPVWAMVSERADPARVTALKDAGAEVFAIESMEKDRNPARVIQALAATGIGSLFLEGGADLASSFLAADLVDEVILARSTVLIGPGGVAAPPTLLAPMSPAQWRRTAFHEMGSDQVTISERIR